MFDPCFDGKRPYFEWLKPKKGGQTSSRIVYKYAFETYPGIFITCPERPRVPSGQPSQLGAAIWGTSTQRAPLAQARLPPLRLHEASSQVSSWT